MKRGFVAFVGFIAVGMIVVGSYYIFYALALRSAPGADEYLVLIDNYVHAASRFEQIENLKSFAAGHRPAMPLKLLAAQPECESLLDSSLSALDKAAVFLVRLPGVSLYDAYYKTSPEARKSIDNMTAISFQSISAYDDCLGNP